MDRLDAVAELVKRPEVLSSVQATLGRMCNLDTLLSLCAILPKTDTLPLVEKRINQVIGLKHALELIPNLVTSLSSDLESPLLQQILEVLKNEAFPEMLESIKSVINEVNCIGNPRTSSYWTAKSSFFSDKCTA